MDNDPRNIPDLPPEIINKWGNPKIDEWRKRATVTHNDLYAQNAGRKYNCCSNYDEIDTMILIYGFQSMPPKSRNFACRINYWYNHAQRKIAAKMRRKIQKHSRDRVYLNVVKVHIFTKDEQEAEIPVFYFKLPNDDCKYIDVNARVYNSWEDFLKTNTIEPSLICYPVQGHYGQEQETEEPTFNDTIELKLAVMESPSCGWRKIAQKYGKTAINFGITVIMLASIAVNVGNIKKMPTKIQEIASKVAPYIKKAYKGIQYTNAAFTIVSSLFRIYDKLEHDEEIKAEVFLIVSSILVCLHNIANEKLIKMGLGDKDLREAKFEDLHSISVFFIHFFSGARCVSSLLSLVTVLVSMLYKVKCDASDYFNLTSALFICCGMVTSPLKAKSIFEQVQQEYIMKHGELDTGVATANIGVKSILTKNSNNIINQDGSRPTNNGEPSILETGNEINGNQSASNNNFSSNSSTNTTNIIQPEAVNSDVSSNSTGNNLMGDIVKEAKSIAKDVLSKKVTQQLNSIAKQGLEINWDGDNYDYHIRVNSEQGVVVNRRRHHSTSSLKCDQENNVIQNNRQENRSSDLRNNGSDRNNSNDNQQQARTVLSNEIGRNNTKQNVPLIRRSNSCPSSSSNRGTERHDQMIHDRNRNPQSVARIHTNEIRRNKSPTIQINGSLKQSSNDVPTLQNNLNCLQDQSYHNSNSTIGNVPNENNGRTINRLFKDKQALIHKRDELAKNIIKDESDNEGKAAYEYYQNNIINIFKGTKNEYVMNKQIIRVMEELDDIREFFCQVSLTETTFDIKKKILLINGQLNIDGAALAQTVNEISGESENRQLRCIKTGTLLKATKKYNDRILELEEWKNKLQESDDYRTSVKRERIENQLAAEGDRIKNEFSRNSQLLSRNLVFEVDIKEFEADVINFTQKELKDIVINDMKPFTNITVSDYHKMIQKIKKNKFNEEIQGRIFNATIVLADELDLTNVDSFCACYQIIENEIKMHLKYLQLSTEKQTEAINIFLSNFVNDVPLDDGGFNSDNGLKFQIKNMTKTILDCLENYLETYIENEIPTKYDHLLQNEDIRNLAVIAYAEAFNQIDEINYIELERIALTNRFIQLVEDNLVEREPILSQDGRRVILQ